MLPACISRLERAIENLIENIISQRNPDDLFIGLGAEVIF